MKKQSNIPASDSVDQIRNILFGEQIKIIEKRFKQLEDNLTKTIEKLANKVDSANKELNALIEKSNKQLQTDTSDLAHQHSEDLKKLKTSLNSKIIDTESDLQNQIQSGLDNLDNKASHRNKLAQLLQDMAAKLAD